MKHHLAPPPSVKTVQKINFNELSKADQIKYVEKQIKEMKNSENDSGMHAQFKMSELQKLNTQLKALEKNN